MSSKKRLQENYRADNITQRFLDAMEEKTAEKRAVLHRQAVAYFANYILGQDVVENMIMEERFASLIPPRPPVEEPVKKSNLIDGQDYIFVLKDGTTLTVTYLESTTKDGQLIYGCQVYERDGKPCGRYFKNINPLDLSDLKNV